jgi:hypothetical protein
MTKAAKKNRTSHRKGSSKAAIDAKRAKAYSDMEPHLCDAVQMSEIAGSLFDSPDKGLLVFAVAHLAEILHQLRQRYYAVDFPP